VLSIDDEFYVRHDVDEFALEYSEKRIFREKSIPRKDPHRNPMKLKFVELPQSLDAKNNTRTPSKAVIHSK
jgi:hypothetical protein